MPGLEPPSTPRDVYEEGWLSVPVKWYTLTDKGRRGYKLEDKGQRCIVVIIRLGVGCTLSSRRVGPRGANFVARTQMAATASWAWVLKT